MQASRGKAVKALMVVGGLFVVLEVVDAFRIEETVFALVFAGLTLLALAWTWTARFGGLAGGPVVLILLALMELAGILFMYPRPDSTLVWIDYTAFAVLSMAIIVLSVMVLRDRRSRPSTASSA